MICENCFEGYVPVEDLRRVTHEMAMDAGDLSYEGMVISNGYNYYQCICCGGNWENCPRCSEGGNKDEG